MLTNQLICHLFLTESSTTTSALIGGVVGAVVTLGIVCAPVIVILLLKRRKGIKKYTRLYEGDSVLYHMAQREKYLECHPLLQTNLNSIM